MNLLLLSKLFILGAVCVPFLDEAQGNTAGMDGWRLRNNFNQRSKKIISSKICN